ncbi:hypothetical protein AB4Z54_32940 [Streptomyces sp. MCAF7]
MTVVEDSSPSATLPVTYSECSTGGRRCARSFMNSTGPVNAPDALCPSSATTSRTTASPLLKCVPQGATMTPCGLLCRTHANGIDRSPQVAMIRSYGAASG